jgi:membrane-bound lytic murein transglycosylase B
VIKHINKPLETNPWNTYQLLFVNEWRIEHGVKFWNKYADVLRRAELKYGVPAGIIVATIGIESKYGQRMGEYRVMDSLTNLGFSDSPRAKYFRGELEQFLLLTRDQHVDPFKMMGSYAGAIGQPQFMPTSYRYYAVNFSGSGKIDLMGDTADVIGSIANYYSKSGWKINGPVAQQAVVVGQRYEYLRKKNQIPQYLSLTELARFGVVPKNKYAYDNDNLKARVIALESHYNKEYWLGYNNFAVIKRYNASDLYAMAVYQLSNYITASREHLQHG